MERRIFRPSLPSRARARRASAREKKNASLRTLCGTAPKAVAPDQRVHPPTRPRPEIRGWGVAGDLTRNRRAVIPPAHPPRGPPDPPNPPVPARSAPFAPAPAPVGRFHGGLGARSGGRGPTNPCKSTSTPRPPPGAPRRAACCRPMRPGSPPRRPGRAGAPEFAGFLGERRHRPAPPKETRASWRGTIPPCRGAPMLSVPA